MPHRATEEKINKVRRKEKESNGQARAKEKQQEAQTERTHEKGEYIEKTQGRDKRRRGLERRDKERDSVKGTKGRVSGENSGLLSGLVLVKREK